MEKKTEAEAGRDNVMRSRHSCAEDAAVGGSGD